jgi:tetratricopeptide (TPR) repeat protein
MVNMRALQLISVFFLVIGFNPINAQNVKEMLDQAIEIMDAGKYDESIALLEACEKLDPRNYIYAYEIGLAQIRKQDYQSAIATLKRTLKFKNINSQVYQLLGNAYSYGGDPISAVKTYETGMKKFPNAGNLHLEKGNVLLYQKNYKEAIESYEKGISVDPMYPSNYYRLALVFMNSSDKLSGLVYGELFLNLEKSSERSLKMSELLFNTYKESVEFLDEGKTKINLCDIIIEVKKLKKNDILELPFCAHFTKSFILGISDFTEINLSSLAQIRINTVNDYFAKEPKKNILLSHQKKMLEAGVFEAYSMYLFQMGSKAEFSDWLENNKEAFDTFVKWYTNPDNYLVITKENRFVRD